MDKSFAKKCAGLKMYLNKTFSTLEIPVTTDWIEVIFKKKFISHVNQLLKF